MRSPLDYLPVYFIAGTQDIVSGELPELLEQALKAGVTCFQFREKGVGSIGEAGQRKVLAAECYELCQKYDVPFIVNDDVELALALDADGIHVGQEDQAIEEVLRLFPGKIVGLSCYNKEEIVAANQLKGISYYGIGPVFGTISKSDAKPPIGIKQLDVLARLAKRPSVAIGGISIETVAAIQETAVAGSAVISAITRSEEINSTINKLKVGG